MARPEEPAGANRRRIAAVGFVSKGIDLKQ